MSGFIAPPPVSDPAKREINWTAVAIGVGAMVIVLGLIALLSLSQHKTPAPPPAYLSSLQLSHLKMSAAENFVGASVTYLDGIISNTGDKTVIHSVVHVAFRNSLGEVAQAEDVPLHVLQTGGPYLDAVDLLTSPLAPGQSKPFRLTFEHVSSDWNQQYPELKIADVTVK
jgi:hypothetical protein